MVETGWFNITRMGWTLRHLELLHLKLAHHFCRVTFDSSYGSGSFVSSSGIDDFGGDESYEASDAYSNDENSYYNENKRKNQAEERHDEYGSDSSGSFACHDEDRDSEGGIIPVFIDELKKADVHDIREVKIDSDCIKLSRTSVTVPCGGIVVWSYLSSGNKEKDLDDYSEFSRFSKFQFKKETNFAGNNQSDFILCYTSPSLRPLEESNAVSMPTILSTRSLQI